MLLQLKNNHIYLPNTTVVDGEVARFIVDIYDIDASKYSFVVNINGTTTSFKREFVIDKSHLKSKYLNMSITATHNETGETVVYTADSYPITKAVILGKPSSEWYPAIIQSLKSRVETLERHRVVSDNSIQTHTDRLLAIEKNIKLIELAIKEINETGEVI